MATYFVRGENGSDSNNGSSRSAAFKTLEKLQTVIGSGDTAYLSEIIQPIDDTGDLFTVSGLSGVRIRQDPNGSQAKVLLFRLVPSGGFSAGAGKYTATIAAGLTLAGVCHNLLTNRKADGRAYGWMHLEASAAAVSGGGAQGQYFYNSGTGVLTVSAVGNADPLGNVGYGVGGRNAIEFNACTGCTVEGIEFYGLPSNTASQAVEFANCTQCVASTCVAYDCGSHAFSSEGNTSSGSGNAFYGCRALTWHEGGTAFVHHASGADITDAVYEFCVCVGGRHLGGDGLVLAGLGSNVQVCWLAHTDGGGEVLASGGLRLSRCTAIETEEANNIVRTDNNGAVGALAFANAQVQCFDCSFTSYGRCYWNQTANRYGFRRCAFFNTTGAALGYGSGAGIYHMLGGGDAIFESCTFDVNMSHAGDAGTNYGVFCVQTSADRIRLYNCTFYDRRTADHLTTTFLHDSSNGTFSLQGNLIVNAKASGLNYNRLFWGDGSASAGQHALSGGNVLVNTTNDVTSQLAAHDTRAKLSALFTLTFTDAAATTVLPSAPTSLGLNSASSAWTLRRPSWTPTGETGINGLADNGRYGAFQYGDTNPGRTERTGRTTRASRAA